MHYWIDGYNLLFYLPKSKSSFEEKRRDLILKLNQKAKAFHIQMTLVFDASDPNQDFDTRSHFDFLEIIYTRPKKTADQAILEIVEQSSKPSNLCVVSSDKDLSFKAKALGSQTLSLPSFLEFLSKKQKSPSKDRSLKGDFVDSPQEIERLLKLFTSEY